MQWRWLLFAALASLVACDVPPAPAPPPALASTDRAAPGLDTNTVARAAADVRGYYESRDGGLFTPCGETERRRVVSISASSRAILQDSVGARFVSARGALLDGGEVEIGQIELTGGDAWNCESKFDQFFYAARGIELPWSLQVTAAAVTFTDSPGAPPLVLAYRPFARSGNAWRFEFQTENALAFRIALVEQACGDRMTDSVYALTATIESGGETYSGCAWRGEREP